MIDRDLLRTLIRDVISSEVSKIRQDGFSSQPGVLEAVSIASDADLAGFAKRVLQAAHDPKLRAAIEAGQPVFRLAGTAPQTVASAAPPRQEHSITAGVVTETMITKLPADVRRLLVGPGVSITPLARDKARTRGISINRSGS
jgi:hypothetical protein